MSEIMQPDAPGGFVGDIWFGHPEKRGLGTHRWDGVRWEELPSELDSVLELLAVRTAQRDAIKAALELAEDVLSRAPFSTQIWPNGMHPNAGIEIIREALAD